VNDADYYKERVNNLMDTLIELGESYGYTREDVEAMVPEIDLGAYAVSAASYLANIVTQMVLVMLIVVYMLLGYDGSNKSVLQSNIDSRIRKYIMVPRPPPSRICATHLTHLRACVRACVRLCVRVR